MSASAAWVNWKSASVWPNIFRVFTRAKPSAAAATEARKISRVRMAILKPSPGVPMRLETGMRQLLAERRRNTGNQLSGGEQQMLAIGRGLLTNPKLLILDEATEGLAPLIRSEIWACLKRLKAEGQAILLVDKHIDALLKLADRHVVIEKGHVVWSG